MKVSCDGVEYGFASVETDHTLSATELLATFHEDGRLAVIAPLSYLKANGIAAEGPYAKLTIEVHTSLELVGLTAVMATELARHGISANVVAAFYHDHVFVQYPLRERAVALLEGLKDAH
jgi:hypothetical protein